jgi:alkanesulfonate monooxygenase SsuD/methylene tetrahydromethanopterin reductase-like flavin-dependent oxidoreductase (luciferase family)
VKERLGLGILPGVGWRASETRAIAIEAEQAGIDAILTAEVNSDAVATAQLMGEATREIKVGTWIASIHMRHSYSCAKAASLIADATRGRMILGLGVSHQSVNAALGVEMPSPTAALRRYATEVAGWLRGEGPATHLSQEPAPVPMPIYLAALTSPTVELAGEIADGVMPSCDRRRAWRRAKCGPRAGGLRRRGADRSTSRSVSRPLSAMTSRRCATQPEPTSPCSPPSRSISECSARAALPKRRQERSRVPAATR